MPDDVPLATDTYGADAGGKRPVLLSWTPYNKNAAEAIAGRYAAAGYVVVVQDERGRYASQGASLPYNNEGQDGFDTLEWITRQLWCNGPPNMATAWRPSALRRPGVASIATPTLVARLAWP